MRTRVLIGLMLTLTTYAPTVIGVASPRNPSQMAVPTVGSISYVAGSS